MGAAACVPSGVDVVEAIAGECDVLVNFGGFAMLGTDAVAFFCGSCTFFSFACHWMMRLRRLQACHEKVVECVRSPPTAGPTQHVVRCGCEFWWTVWVYW